ncbi:unnamed protein product, partial [Closterium sp. NIES-65]
FISNNSLYGPLPDCLFDKCITQIDVSGNSLYGRINRDFKNMVTTMGAPARDFEYIAADDSPIVNLAHNFFFGDGVLFALGCKVCPTEINKPNNLGIRDSFAWRELGGKCNFLAPNMPARVSLSGNCLTLTLNNQCSSNATQRSTAACQAFCSITDNGPCDGHGACVPADPASPSNFTCLCDAGVSPSNPSVPFHLAHYCTTFLASFPTPHLSQFSLSTALMLASPLPSCSPLLCPHARLSSARMLASPLPSCSPLLCPHAPLSTALMLAFPLPSCSPSSSLMLPSPLPSCSLLLCPHAPLSTALMLASPLPSCSPLHCPHARFSSALMLPSPLPSCSLLLCPHAPLSTALMLASPLPSCSPLHCPHARLCSALMLASALLSCSVHASTPLVSHTSGLKFFLCAEKWEGLDVCEQFSLQQMLSATSNWSEDNVLGKGGFGIVYKGRSPQGQLWAIKRSTIMTNDFETEVRAMASLHHTHLVRLLGFCLDQNVETGKQEQILVYEFMANRDLEYHIHRTKRPLSLRQRLRLAQGAAEGLAYLHGFDTPIVHRDIKPANILVSADMQAKAMKLVETYEVEELRDSKMPAVSEEAIVDFADLALDCIKSPGTRRPTMKDVAYRLSALIDKHCPDEEDEWENVVTEEGTSNQGMPSELCGGGGREPERSHGSQSGVISFTVLPRRNTRPLPASSPLLPSLLLPPSLTAGVTACCCALIPLSCLVSVLRDRRMGGTAAASNSKSCFMHAPFCSTCSPCSLCSFCSLARLSCLVSVRDRCIGGGTGAGYVTACSLAPCITPILSLPLHPPPPTRPPSLSPPSLPSPQPLPTTLALPPPPSSSSLSLQLLF